MIKIEVARLRRLSKEASWIVLGQGMAVVGALVGVRILTGLLDPTQYGELALGLTVAGLVNQVIMAPLSAGVSRFYTPASEKRDLHGYIKASRRLMIGATAAVGVLAALLVTGLLVLNLPQRAGLALAAFVLALFNGYSGVLNGVQNAARQRSIVALHQGMDGWMRFLFAAALILWLGSMSVVAMLGYALASLLVLGSQYLFFRRMFASQIVKANRPESWSPQIMRFSWPFATWGIFTWAQLASDRWALEIFTTTREVGLYAVLFQLGYLPMSLATGMAIQFLAPIFYQRAGDATNQSRNADVHDLVWRFAGLSLCMTALAFLAALLLHGPIFQVLVARKYAEVSYLLPWTILAGGVFAAGQTLSLKLMSELRSRALVAAKIVTALIGVALNYLGAYYAGVGGIVLAGVAFSAAYFFWMLMIATRSRQVSLA